MSLFESLRIAVAGLVTNRLRAVLTTLGIIIGVGAVIGLVSLGRGVELFVAQEFQSLGSNLLFVFSSRPASDTRTTIQPLSTIEADALANPTIAPSIRQVAPQYQVGGQIVAGANSFRLAISGSTPNYTSVRSWFPSLGTFITQEHVTDAARVAVLGTTIVEILYGDSTFDPVGQSVRINDRVFTVIGVMEERAAGFLGDENEAVFIPISTAQTRLDRARTRDGGFEVSVLNIQAVDESRMVAATLEIETYLNDAHGINFQGEQDFTIISQADILDSLGAITGILTAFLGMIAGISLLVGGIGIMNIMLVSVTERTREIGLRKAVGARGVDILMQFLIESVVLSVIGGGLGVLLGVMITLFAGVLVPDLALGVTTDSIILATAVSSFIGIFFGAYPASRAARLRPIDALRFE
ncbi:MAG: FtsX-like permease family protein [Chloroflexi bacterium]|nr:FtsX-like permease family protein [Chloroflexota bacterium]